MTRSRPSVEQERWLAAADRLLGASGDDTALRAALAARTGGWRTTGTLARAALFGLGVLAALLATGLVWVTFGGDGGSSLPWLLAGLLVLATGEYLIRVIGLHASGVEEALVLGGAALLVAWLANGRLTGADLPYALCAAEIFVGLRLLNPLFVAGGVFGAVATFAASDAARAIDGLLGVAATGPLVAMAVAAAALALAGRTWPRPSHDRTLGWLVAALPVVTYAFTVGLGSFEGGHALRDALRGGPAVAIGATALGAASLVLGLRRRAHAPLLGFLGSAVVLAVELRTVGDVPPWLYLTTWGAIALVAAITIDRRLRTPRDGYTSERIGSETAMDLLHLVGTSALAQRTTPAGPAPHEEFAGGGGRTGGGGASGSY
jgi:hypothetical protein